MTLHRLHPHTPLAPLCERLGVTREGIRIMEPKAQPQLFLLQSLPTPAANILKQEALSIGADLAVPKETVCCGTPKVDAVLIATRAHCERLVRKLRAQPFGLTAVAQQLQRHLHAAPASSCMVMGVINANDDSFYAGSRFEGARVLEEIERMIAEGAHIIDVGGVSSRPGSLGVSAEEEMRRVGPLLEGIKAAKLYEKARFSIDSYTPRVIARALECGFTIINDITGLADDAVAALAAEHGATVVIMHKKGDPQTMQDAPRYDDVLEEVSCFFEERLAKARRFGIADVWLDVGIGFGKRLQDNLQLLRHLEHFLVFGCPLLVGASRKSMIDQIAGATVEARLPGTLVLHLEAVRNGARILRCHDVAAHTQALKIHEALSKSL